jgi:hypothetical protein
MDQKTYVNTTNPNGSNISVVESTTQPPKRGVATTEFWLVLSANLITTTLAALEKMDAQWATLTVTILTAIYALIRALIKITPR